MFVIAKYYLNLKSAKQSTMKRHRGVALISVGGATIISHIVAL